jgi:hypothetical protein
MDKRVDFRGRQHSSRGFLPIWLGRGWADPVPPRATLLPQISLKSKTKCSAPAAALGRSFNLIICFFSPASRSTSFLYTCNLLVRAGDSGRQAARWPLFAAAMCLGAEYIESMKSTLFSSRPFSMPWSHTRLAVIWGRWWSWSHRVVLVPASTPPVIVPILCGRPFSSSTTGRDL